MTAHSKLLTLPQEPFYRPLGIFLKHHRENLFEKFRQIRRLPTKKQNEENANEYELSKIAAEP